MYWEGNYYLNFMQFPVFLLRTLQSIKSQLKEIEQF